ncbi:MAG: hypothetical protein AB8I08_04045 [Sandaracinaceae bacterium]
MAGVDFAGEYISAVAKQGGSNAVFWIIGGIVVLMLAGISSTIWISVSNDVSSGYVPLEERTAADAAP